MSLVRRDIGGLFVHAPELKEKDGGPKHSGTRNRRMQSSLLVVKSNMNADIYAPPVFAAHWTRDVKDVNHT